MSYPTPTNPTAPTTNPLTVASPGSPHTGDESNLWLPPRQMRRYQRNKVIGALLMMAIFSGWLILQWSNFVMRIVAGSLITMTLWVLIQSILEDLRRGRGRQIQIIDEQLCITNPDGVTTVELGHVADARWDDETPGLSFYDGHGQTLACLDCDFLADEAEARCFLGWARKHAHLPFKVRWP